MIRHAERKDLETIQAVYARARRFMAENGNPTQWADGYPQNDKIERAIADQTLYVSEDGGEVHGVFLFAVKDDPTYRLIEDGAWLSDEPYGVIHMVASDGTRHGFTSEVVEFCRKQTGHLRIDTHHDNHVMQRAIQKCGFQRCGIIHVEDGSPRIAYEMEEKKA